MFKKGLGKGLGALFNDNGDDNYESLPRDILEQKTSNVISETKPQLPTTLRAGNVPHENLAQELPIKLIDPNVNQPRKVFDEVALGELANSIRIHGVISPIIVVKVDARYMIIAGERRFRASKKAGLMTIPCIIRDYNDKQIKEISLIDNLQREDLNPIETAIAIKQLMDEFSYTQEEVSDRIGKSRPAVTNTLRLLSLSAPVIDLVAKGRLSPGHARCLVVVADPTDQLDLAKCGMDNKVNVRDFEKLVKSFLVPKVEKPKPLQSIELKDLIGNMQRSFSTKVSALGNDNKGRIYIDYYSRDDLDRIIEIIDVYEKNKPNK